MSVDTLQALPVRDTDYPWGCLGRRNDTGSDPNRNMGSPSRTYPPIQLSRHTHPTLTDATSVSLDRCRLGSHLRPHRWARRPLHPRAHWYAYRGPHPAKQERRRHPHCVCGPSRVWVLNVLGPDTVGVPRGELPTARAGQVYRVG